MHIWILPWDSADRTIYNWIFHSRKKHDSRWNHSWLVPVGNVRVHVSNNYRLSHNRCITVSYYIITIDRELFSCSPIQMTLLDMLFNKIIIRYKPVILLSAVAGSVVFALIAWTDSFVGLLMAQVVYGTYMATEIAYFTYIYAKVERGKYQLVTGQTRSAKLVGSFLGCTLSQVSVSFGLLSYFALTVSSFASESSSSKPK